MLFLDVVHFLVADQFFNQILDEFVAEIVVVKVQGLDVQGS